MADNLAAIAGGIEIRTSKTGVPLCFRWTEALRTVVGQAKGRRQSFPNCWAR